MLPWTLHGIIGTAESDTAKLNVNFRCKYLCKIKAIFANILINRGPDGRVSFSGGNIWGKSRETGSLNTSEARFVAKVAYVAVGGFCPPPQKKTPKRRQALKGDKLYKKQKRHFFPTSKY